MTGKASINLFGAGFVWGFGEATLFFVVPDVLLTFVAQRKGFRAAAIATAFAVLGACLGGGLMWMLGRAYPANVIAVLDTLPAISKEMIARAEHVLSGSPFMALVEGAFSGVPYKIFASLAAHAGIALPVFLLITIPARAARFLLLAAATAAADRLAARWLDKRTRTAVLAGGWVAFYAAYRLLMPN